MGAPLGAFQILGHAASVSRARYSLVKGEKIVRSGVNTRPEETFEDETGLYTSDPARTSHWIWFYSRTGVDADILNTTNTGVAL